MVKAELNEVLKAKAAPRPSRYISYGIRRTPTSNCYKYSYIDKDCCLESSYRLLGVIGKGGIDLMRWGADSRDRCGVSRGRKDVRKGWGDEEE